jgi:hypothetical protein
MKNKIPLIFSLSLLLALAFGSCKTPPCPEYEVKVDTINIPETRKAPLKSYTGFDTLNFLTDKGDTVTFLGQGQNTGYNKLDIYAEDNCTTKRTEFMQFIGYTFYPISNYTSDIQFYVSPQLRTGSPFHLFVLLNKISYSTFSDLPPLTSPVYIQGLYINGHTYNNVYKIYRNFDFKEKSYIYYSLSEGIIQIVLPSNETLSKIK